MKGFTLVEILIVFVITIVLLAIVWGVGYYSQIERVNDVARKRNLAELRDGLEIFHREKGRYPAANEIGAPISGAANAAVVCGDKQEMERYMIHIPCDPKHNDGQDYVYYVFNAGQDFALFTNIKTQDDVAVKQSACENGCSYINDDGQLAEAFYNYAVFSSLDYMNQCDFDSGAYCSNKICLPCASSEDCRASQTRYCFQDWCHNNATGIFPKNCQ